MSMRLMVGAMLCGVLLTVSPAEAAPADGARLFASRCGICHWDPAKPGEQKRLGPSLTNMFGRQSASDASFTRYSKALKSHKKIWNEATLNAFLEAPARTIPGTSMSFVGLKKPEERAAVIAYLKAHGSPRR